MRRSRRSADEFVARVNRDLDALDLEGQRGGLDPEDLHHRGYRARQRARQRPLSRRTSASPRKSRSATTASSSRPRRRAPSSCCASTCPRPRRGCGAARAEMTQVMARLTGMYGEGKYCPKGKPPEACRNLDQLSDTLAKSRNYDELVEAWKGWHDVAAPMREPYRRSRSSRTKARASSASRTSASCGAPAMTCRRKSSTRSRRSCGSR